MKKLLAMLVLGLSAAPTLAGVTVDAWTLQFVSGDPLGLGQYVPAVIPLQPSAGGVFTYSTNALDLDNTYDIANTDCLKSCLLGQLTAPGPSLPQLMEVNFSQPVSTVNVLQFADWANAAFVQAFNSADS